MKSWLSKLAIRFKSPTIQKQISVDTQTLYNSQRKSELHSSLCFAPSVNMVFAQDGTVKACCHNSENLLGRYPKQSISEIWNSTEAQLFRQRMSEYKFLSGCGICAADYGNNQFAEMPALHFDSLPKHSSYPTMMEFLLSNKCNLECVMCNGELSSSIRKNRDKLPTINSPYSDAFVEQLQEFVPYLHETRFSGAGEAFSIDLNYRIWESLIQKNPACEIVVQTNGTVMNDKVRDFLQMGNFRIGVSLDSLQKESYERIRINASFERVLENVNHFAAYSANKDKHFTISTCVMRSNWHELPQFVLFCNNLGAHCLFHKVWFPLHHSLYNLPANELGMIHEALSEVQLPDTTSLERKNKRHYEYYLSVVKNWEKQQLTLSQTAIQFTSLSVYELKLCFYGELENYIATQSMLEADKNILVNICQQKIEALLSFCSSEKEQRLILETMNGSSVEGVLPAIKTNTPEKLYEMSKAYAATVPA